MRGSSSQLHSGVRGSVEVSDGDSEHARQTKVFLHLRHDAVRHRVVRCRAHRDVRVDIVVVGYLHEVLVILLESGGIVNIYGSQCVSCVNT